MSVDKKQMSLKSTLKNKPKLLATPKSPRSWKTVPSTKASKSTQLNDQVVSTKDLEAFCEVYFDISPSAKPIDAIRSVLQELERALKQIYDSAKIVYYSLTLERVQDGYVAPPDVSINDEESIPKFLTKLSKFPSMQAEKRKNLHQSPLHLLRISR